MFILSKSSAIVLAFRANALSSVCLNGNDLPRSSQVPLFLLGTALSPNRTLRVARAQSANLGMLIILFTKIQFLNKVSLKF